MRALSDVLSLADPEAYGRASRVQRLALELAEHSELNPRWPLELAALLDLDLDSLSLAALARHWSIRQARPHDALDDARVLAAVLQHALARAAELTITLPVRSPATLPPVQIQAAA